MGILREAALAVLAVLFIATPAYAQQPSLTDQINAVDTVQERQKAEMRREQEKAYAAAVASQRKREAKAESIMRSKQAYENKLQDMNLQHMQLRLDAEKARVARENEFIDRELKAQDAETDVVKSQADATRDIASGAKTYMEKSGEAAVKSQSR